MNSQSILQTARLPARIDWKDASLMLGLKDHDIHILIRAGMMKPLGNPAPNSPKYFATSEIVALCEDVDWLDKATRTISRHWKRKNANAKERRQSESLD